MNTLHEFVPFLVAKGHVCAFCLCAFPLCSHERGDKAVHYQARDRRLTWTWYRADRGRFSGWTMAHLFPRLVTGLLRDLDGRDLPGLDIPVRLAPTAVCGWGIRGRPSGCVLFAPALPEDPRCSRCERLEAT